jgi:hypothetical protein
LKIWLCSIALLLAGDATALTVEMNATILGDASDSVTVTDGGGIGIEGAGANDGDVDGGESIQLSLAGESSHVTYRVTSASNVDGEARGSAASGSPPLRTAPASAA